MCSYAKCDVAPGAAAVLLVLLLRTALLARMCTLPQFLRQTLRVTLLNRTYSTTRYFFVTAVTANNNRWSADVDSPQRGNAIREIFRYV